MRLFRKIIFWILGIILVIAIQGVMLIYFYEKEIKDAAVAKINEQVNTPIKVGKIELSYFKHFPFISLSFPDVILYDSKPGHKDVLLSAKEISLFFNIWDIYKGDYVVKKLFIDEADWNSVIDKNGKSNFEIIKESNSSSTNTKFNLNIKEIIIKISTVLHVDLQNNFVYSSSIPDFIANGNFNAGTITSALSFFSL